MEFALVLVMALLVEFIIQTVKEIIGEGKPNWYMLGAAVLGGVLCVLGGLDIFKLSGIELSVPHVGAALTGVACGRGSNLIHDLIKNIKGALDK
jgi:hypothetical protein